jgi:cyclophilin family peptidyl-prolyl cis-trans isomerase
MKLRFSILCAAILLVGCDHHKPADQAQASNAPVAQDDSDVTGLPPQAANSTKPSTPPRAQAVSLPPATTATNAAPENSTPPLTPPVETETAAPPPEPHMAARTLDEPPPPPVSPATIEPVATSSVAANDAPNQEQVVVLKTTFGNIVIELDSSAAPRTCENFRNLVSDGFYDHTVFHRVIPNFIIQGGDPTSKGPNRAAYGLGGPGYKLRPEIKLTHDEGAVAMARLPDSVNPTRESNGSQFYICLVDCPSLDAQYTVFGHVIKGLDVAKKIGDAPRDAKDDPLARIEMSASLVPKSQAMANDSSN